MLNRAKQLLLPSCFLPQTQVLLISRNVIIDWGTVFIVTIVYWCRVLWIRTAKLRLLNHIFLWRIEPDIDMQLALRLSHFDQFWSPHTVAILHFWIPVFENIAVLAYLFPARLPYSLILAKPRNRIVLVSKVPKWQHIGCILMLVLFHFSLRNDVDWWL